MPNFFGRFFKENSFKQAVLIIFIFDNLSRLLNFFKNILVAVNFGFAKITDAYNYSLTIVNTPFNLIADALLAGLIPFLSHKKTEQEKLNFVYSLVFLLLLTMALISCAFLLFYNPILSLIAPGFDGQTRDFSFEFSVFIIGTGLLLLATRTIEGYLRSMKIFGISNLTRFIASLTAIIIMILFINQNYRVIALAPLIGNALAFLIFFAIIPKKITAFDREVFSLLKFALPLILSGGVGIINNMVDKGFATTLDSGNLTALNYGFMLMLQAKALIIGPLAGASFSFIASDISENNIENLQIRVSKLADTIVALFTLIIFCFLLFGFPVLKLLFLYGKVKTEDLSLLFQLASIYFGMLIFTGVAGLAVQIAYSYKNTKAPTLINLIAISLNIILNIFFVRFFGVYALAASTVLISILSSLVTCLYIYKKYKIQLFKIKHLFIAFCGVSSLLLFSYFQLQDNYLLGAILLLIAVIILIASKTLDIKYLKSLFKRRRKQ